MNKCEAIIASFRSADGNGDKKPSNPDWVEKATESEHPVKDPTIFQDSAEKIADYFSKPSTSPKGLGQAVQKLNFYIQRGKHNLAEKQIEKVHKAMEIIQQKNKEKSR